MNEASVPVKIRPGMFSTERYVTILTYTGLCEAWVDVSCLDTEACSDAEETPGRLLVYPVWGWNETPESLMVDLPCQDSSGGTRIRIHRGDLGPPIERSHT